MPNLWMGRFQCWFHQLHGLQASDQTKQSCGPSALGLRKTTLTSLALYRYLGQLLDAEDAISSIRKGMDVLQQQIATLVRLLHHLHTQQGGQSVQPCTTCVQRRSLL